MMDLLKNAFGTLFNQILGITAFLGTVFILVGALSLLKTKRRFNQMVEAVKSSEEKHRLLLQAIPSVVFKGYADWSVEFFDDKFEKLSGYAIEDFNTKKMKWDEVILPEDKEGAKEILKEALKGSRSYVREYRIKVKSGEVHWIRERAKIICDADGMIEYITGVCSDISEEHELKAVLEANEENFRMLIQSVPSVVFKGYSDGSVDFFDNKVEGVTGYAVTDFSSRKRRWHELILPEDQDKAKEIFKKALKTENKSYLREYRLKAKSGDILWIRERAQIVFNDKGQIDYVSGIFSDITEEHELQADLERLRLQDEMILNSIGEGLFMMDRAGKITFVNPIAAQLTGYEADEMMGHNLHDLIHQKRPDGSVYPQAECPMYATLTTGKISHEADEVFWTKKGEPLPVEYMTTPIQQEGQVVGAVGVFRDVTLRKRGEEEIKKAQQYLNNILDNSAESIGIVDRHGVVKKWNKASEEIYGYSFDELKGKPAYDLYADKDELAKMLIQIRRDGFVKNYEIQMKRKDGSTFPCSLSIRVLRDEEGKNMGSVTVARDLTEMKENLAKLQAANKKLQALVDESNQRNRNMTLLQEMSDVFQSCQTSGETYSAIAHFAPKFFPDYAGALYILNNAKDLFELTAVWGDAAAVEMAFGHDECWSLRRTRVYLVANPAEVMNCRHVSSELPGSYLCVPMMAQGEIMGIFHLQKADQEDPEQMKVIGQFGTTVAEAMALALANLKLRETLRNQAIRDALTGLFNRRYLEETMERELSRGKRQGSPLGVIMLDLDHFKDYNDTYGHNFGDELLVALGQLIQEQVRREDIACRYGGEEFLLMLPGAPLEAVVARAQELNQSVKKLHTTSSSLKPITISAGVAIYPKNGSNAKDVIRAADAALYRAKTEGRDRVVVAEGLESMVAAN